MLKLLGRAATDRLEHRRERHLVEGGRLGHRQQIAVDPADRRLAELQVDVGRAEVDRAHEEAVEIHPLERGIGGPRVFL